MEQFVSNSRKRVKKLTDNEIIKALECCTNPRVNEKCPRSKFVDICNDGCIHLLMKQALDLINCQKAEIERLQLKIDGVKDANAILREHNEIAVANTIKEFAERLKEKGHMTKDGIVVVDYEIDNLVKESEVK